MDSSFVVSSKPNIPVIALKNSILQQNTDGLSNTTNSTASHSSIGGETPDFFMGTMEGFESASSSVYSANNARKESTESDEVQFIAEIIDLTKTTQSDSESNWINHQFIRFTQFIQTHLKPLHSVSYLKK